MTQEEKQLLIQELCARSPYKVKVQIDFGEHCIKYGIDRYVDDTVICVWPETFEIGVNDEDQACDIEDVKPYLRPLSSMTEEEKEHLQTLHDIISDENYGDGFSPAAWEAILDFNNYCREHHLDNGGLITLGLALEAPEGMYNTKIE